MKYLEEYRDPDLAIKLQKKIRSITSGKWSIMEICGGQTHSIMKYNIDQLLPNEINFIHGPGCPVCVTPIEKIDMAVNLAQNENVILITYGDMMRVPGSKEDLLSVKAEGADVRMVYSPLDALHIAENNPNKEVVFFAIGFETTAPANAYSVLEAERRNVKNFSLLSSHVLVPPAIELLMSDGKTKIDGILAAGHVCTIMGLREYELLVDKYKLPVVVTGFEPIDILHGVSLVVEQLEENRAELENQYYRVVSREGNIAARESVSRVFEITNAKWRGIGEIPRSGLKMRRAFSDYDAEEKFNLGNIYVLESDLCIAGLVLQGKKKPNECSEFGRLCKPESPLGAPMVSSEGACAAYFHYK